MPNAMWLNPQSKSWGVKWDWRLITSSTLPSGQNRQKNSLKECVQCHKIHLQTAFLAILPIGLQRNYTQLYTMFVIPLRNHYNFVLSKVLSRMILKINLSLTMLSWHSSRNCLNRLRRRSWAFPTAFLIFPEAEKE